MVCLKRLCKQYRCWTTLKMEVLVQEGWGWWERIDALSPAYCLEAGDGAK